MVIIYSFYLFQKVYNYNYKFLDNELIYKLLLYLLIVIH